MAGGTFTSQNKVRPGAYINFKSVSPTPTTLGTAGIVALCAPMNWGSGVIELLGTELIDGKSVAKIGYGAQDTEALLFREALKNCYKALIFRLDLGGLEATLDISDLTIDAKYYGTAGNDISVAVVANGANFDVITYYKGVEKDKQTVADSSELIANDWVVFSYTTGVLTANAGAALTGGTNGTVNAASYTAFRAALVSYKWSVMGVPQDISTEVANFESYVNTLRNVEGKKVQVVLFDAGSDNEGIISVAQGYGNADYTVLPHEAVAYIAGVSAGAEIAQSNTYHVLSYMNTITYPSGVDPYTDEVIKEKLAEGEMVLSTRSDGAIVIEKDINTLHTFTPTKNYDFSKNRVLRTLDAISNIVANKFEVSYIGKVSNNASGRTLFKGDLVGLMNTLQSVEAIQNFDSATDVEVLEGETIDSVVVNLAIQPVDSMEKLYMTVLVG